MQFNFCLSALPSAIDNYGLCFYYSIAYQLQKITNKQTIIINSQCSCYIYLAFNCVIVPVSHFSLPCSLIAPKGE